jgi:hypothetical protein
MHTPLTHHDVLSKDLKVMDAGAIPWLCSEVDPNRWTGNWLTKERV